MYVAALQYSTEMYWMGWDGPNEAGVATFQASTGQTRAPHRGSQYVVDLGLFGVRTGH